MEQDILVLELSALDGWCDGNPLGWAEISGESVIYIDLCSSSPLIGSIELRRHLNSFIGKTHSPRKAVLKPRIVLKEDAALLTYMAVFNDESWNVTSVYFRQDNDWKLVHGHRSLVNHTQPAATEVPLLVKNGGQSFEGLIQDLMILESGAMERWRKGDPWGFIEISAPDVTYFDTGTRQRIDGRKALEAEYALREGKIFYDVMDFIDPLLLVQQDMAVLVYRFLSTWLNPDGSVARRVPWSCTEVYVKYDDRWLINHTHWSIIQGVRPQG